jgi:O-antigen/teichoic acid export membrane protein
MSDDRETVERGDVARGAATAAMARLGAAIEIIAQPVYTWLFGLATYGLYIVLWSAVNLAEKVLDLSLTQALQRIVPVEDETVALGAVKFAILVTFIPALIVALIVSLNAEHLATLLSVSARDARHLPTAIALFAWALPLWILVEVTTSAIRARRAFGPEIRLRIFWEQLARLAFAVGFFFAGWASTGLLMAHLLSLLLVAFLSLRLLGRYYDLRLMWRAPIPASLRARMLVTGIALMPSSIARRALSDLPPIILNVILPGSQGATAAGLFGIARKLASVPLIVRQAFLYVLAPLSSAQAALDPTKVAPLYLFSARLSAALVLPIGGVMILLANDLLSIFGPGADAAYFALIYLLIGRMAESILGPATPIVEMTGHRILPLANAIFGISVWAILAWWLTPALLVDGMAIAVGAGAATTALAAVIELRITDKLTILDTPFLRGLVAGLLGFAVLALFNVLFEQLGATMRAIGLIVLSLPIFWITLRLGLDMNDRKGLGKLAERIRLV